MPSFTYKKCCLCIELKTGCFIIGYLHLIVNMIIIIFSVSSLDAGDDKNGEAGMAFGVLYLLVLILFYAFIIILLVGLHQDKPGHVKAYLIAGTVFAVLTAFYYVIKDAVSNSDPLDIVQDILSFLWNIYFLLVIRSQYYRMEDSSRESVISNTT